MSRQTNSQQIFQNDKAPVGNTGLKCQNQENGLESQNNCTTPSISFTIKIDWLRVILPIESRTALDDLIDWLQRLFADEMVWFDCKVREGRTWENYGRSVAGISAYYNLPDYDNDKLGEVMLNFPATVIDRIGQSAFFWVMQRLYFDFKARATRTDLALDDYLKLLSYDKLQDVKRLHNVKRFRNITPYEKWVSGELKGWCYYYGSRQSDVMFRIYDKSAETKGEIDAVRLEGEYHNELANDIFQKCAELYAELSNIEDGAELAARGLVHYLFNDSYGINFIDRQGTKKRADRCNELSWWTNFKQSVLGYFEQLGTKLELARAKVKPTLRKSFEWLDTKVTNAFTASVKVRGLDTTLSMMLKDWKDVPKRVKAMIRVALLETQEGMVMQT